jgi:hypothetical protein
MATSADRRSASRKPTGSAVNDMTRLLAKHYPGVSKSAAETTAKAAVALAAVAAGLSPEQQRRIMAHRENLPRIVASAIADLDRGSGTTPNRLVNIIPRQPVETSHGAGIGETISRKEGVRRLAEYATPHRLEDWAGPVAGPSELERRYGIRRSTLHEWQKRGAVIGLLKGERKHVFPLDQFVDSRPVQGMSQITAIIDNPRTAWQWLVRPHPTGDRSPPLARLKAGRVDEVRDAAMRDFG